MGGKRLETAWQGVQLILPALGGSALVPGPIFHHETLGPEPVMPPRGSGVCSQPSTFSRAAKAPGAASPPLVTLNTRKWTEGRLASADRPAIPGSSEEAKKRGENGD